MRDMREVLNIVIVFTLSNIYILSASSICKGYTFYVIHYTYTTGLKSQRAANLLKIIENKGFKFSNRNRNSADIRDKR